MDSSANSSSSDSKREAHAGQPVSRPAPVQLTEEEKAVLLECRRKSVARGLPLGVASVVVLRWLVAQGRTPLHVQRWPFLYYSGAFLGSFMIGVASYRKTCFEKIMALENSFLASQVREHLGRIQKEGFKSYESGCRPDPTNDEARRPKSQYQQQQEQRTYPPPRKYRQPSSHGPTSDAPSSLNADTYSREKAALDARQEPVEQPDAFGSTGAYPQSYDTHTESAQDKQNTPSRGRTFDDIREENRRRQLQRSFPCAPSSGRASSSERRGTGVEGDWRQSGRSQERQQGSIKRKNKYGDDVYED